MESFFLLRSEKLDLRILSLSAPVHLGMEYLHHRHIYRNLSPSVIKEHIGELCVSTVLPDKGDGSITPQVGSPHYLVPDFDEAFAPTVQCDAFSFGVILSEIRTGSAIFCQNFIPNGSDASRTLQ
jgi:hypothetical protein